MVSLPQKPIDGSMAEQAYCSICYLYRLNGQIPIITCDNSKCHLVYHTTCLKEWFSSIRESKTFLNVTSGNCPSCKEVDNGLFKIIQYHADVIAFAVLFSRNYPHHSFNSSISEASGYKLEYKKNVLKIKLREIRSHTQPNYSSSDSELSVK